MFYILFFFNPSPNKADFCLEVFSKSLFVIFKMRKANKHKWPEPASDNLSSGFLQAGTIGVVGLNIYVLSKHDRK